MHTAKGRSLNRRLFARDANQAVGYAPSSRLAQTILGVTKHQLFARHHTSALPELLAAQCVFPRQLVLVNALLDEQEILRIRCVDYSAGKQITQVILPVLAVKPGDLVNRFNPCRSE